MEYIAGILHQFHRQNAVMGKKKETQFIFEVLFIIEVLLLAQSKS